MEISQEWELSQTHTREWHTYNQNLKALGLWVFFLICCSTFSLLLNVELRLTLRYLTNLPLRVPSTLVHSPSSGSIFKYEFLNHKRPSLVSLELPFTHLNGTCFPETSVRKTFDTGSNCTRPSRKPSALIPLVGRIRGENLENIWSLMTRYYKYDLGLQGVSSISSYYYSYTLNTFLHSY